MSSILSAQPFCSHKKGPHVLGWRFFHPDNLTIHVPAISVAQYSGNTELTGKIQVVEKKLLWKTNQTIFTFSMIMEKVCHSIYGISFFSGGALQLDFHQSGWSIFVWETIFPNQNYIAWDDPQKDKAEFQGSIFPQKNIFLCNVYLKCPVFETNHHLKGFYVTPTEFPRKLTWLAGKTTIFNAKYIFKWLDFSIVMLVFGVLGSFFFFGNPFFLPVQQRSVEIVRAIQHPTEIQGGGRVRSGAEVGGKKNIPRNDGKT